MPWLCQSLIAGVRVDQTYISNKTNNSTILWRAIIMQTERTEKERSETAFQLYFCWLFCQSMSAYHFKASQQATIVFFGYQYAYIFLEFDYWCAMFG